MFLTFVIFTMDNTKFLMNLGIQEVGYFLQYSIFQLNFWTGKSSRALKEEEE